jgi:hypothetical protein
MAYLFVPQGAGQLYEQQKRTWWMRLCLIVVVVITFRMQLGSWRKMVI